MAADVKSLSPAMEVMARMGWTATHNVSTFEANTGCMPGVFNQMMALFGGATKANGRPIKNSWDMFLVLHHLKTYPLIRANTAVLKNGPRSKGIGDWSAGAKRVKKLITRLGTACSVYFFQTAPASLRSPSNKLEPAFEVLGSGVVGAVDVFPIRIRRPSKDQSLYYQGKYKAHVLKIQLVTNNQGVPAWFSGPHLGPISDIEIFRHNRPPLQRHEKLLADKAYVDSKAPDWPCITPFKKKRGEERLPAAERTWSRLHSFVRATIEHSIGFIKKAMIIGSKYRGHVTKSADELYLKGVVSILMFMANMHITASPRRDYATRFGEGELTEAVLEQWDGEVKDELAQARAILRAAGIDPNGGDEDDDDDDGDEDDDDDDGDEEDEEDEEEEEDDDKDDDDDDGESGVGESVDEELNEQSAKNKVGSKRKRAPSSSSSDDEESRAATELAIALSQSQSAASVGPPLSQRSERASKRRRD